MAVVFEGLLPLSKLVRMRKTATSYHSSEYIHMLIYWAVQLFGYGEKKSALELMEAQPVINILKQLHFILGHV